MQKPPYEYMHEGLDRPATGTRRQSLGAVAGRFVSYLADHAVNLTSQYSNKGIAHPLIAVLAPQVSPETLFLLRQQASERAGHS
jgi:hypothetical protein